MPQARRSGSGARRTSNRAQTKRSNGSSSAPKSSASSPEARLEAAATRVRKLNEQIIDAAKEAGEGTLSSYETALKAIAGAVERGPGTSQIDWIAQLATTQAKFIRDVTEAWTSAAREMLK